MPNLAHSIQAADVNAKIAQLISNLVDITDETGEFLLRLDDGRVIDTKGWNDWEWTHGVGLFGNGPAGGVGNVGQKRAVA